MKTYPLILLIAESLLLSLLPIRSIAETNRPLDTEILTNAITKEPNSHELRVIAGFHYFDQGDFDTAETHFKKASELTPDDPYDRAWLYMAQLRHNKNASQKDIRAFLATKRSDEFIYTDILILLSDVAPDAAIQKATALKDSGNLCEAHYYAAQRLLADGHAAEAKAHLQEVIKTQKENFWEYKSAVGCFKLL